jgi:hypothetical protein
MSSGFWPCAARVRDNQSATARMPQKVSDGWITVAP